MKQNCGTCKWWEQWPDETDHVGDCKHSGPYVIPNSIKLAGRTAMYPTEGEHCPCWQAKEQS